MDMQTIMQKSRMGIPLTAEEQDFLKGGAAAPAPAPTMGQPPLSSVGSQESKAAQQYTPEELELILSTTSDQGRLGQLDRQYEAAQKLRDMDPRDPGMIRMSSGTAYTPAKSTGETIAEALRAGVGQYGMKRADDRTKDILKKQRKATEAWGRRVMDPVSETGAEIRKNSEKDLGDLVAPQYDLGDESIWEKLRKYGRMA